MSRHLKRLAAPKSWRIPRKTSVWTVKPRPGPHPIGRGLPLLVILRDILKYSDTRREGKKIIGRGEILIDGKIVKDYKRIVGLLDVISIPKLKKHYRVGLDVRGKICLTEIRKKDSSWKLARIENKKNVKGGKIQLNCHDGRNIILKKDKYNTGDTLKIELPSQKILSSYQLKKGNIAIIIGGKHAGAMGKIKEYRVVKSPKPNIVEFEKFSTIQEQVFITGDKKSLIEEVK